MRKGRKGMRKLKVGVVFGGRSAEHEVSLQSAKNIVDAIDKNKYDVVLIGIDKEGKWRLYDPSSYLFNAEDPKHIQLNVSDNPIAVVPGETTNQLIHAQTSHVLDQLDVVFPIVHGTLGEDGSLQGLLRILNLPFVGTGVLGSSVCMDKDIAKTLLKSSGVHVANGVTFTRFQRSDIEYHKVVEQLGTPLFIKPANQGSSVGVSKVATKEEFEASIDTAFNYDHKIVIEEAIVGREIEISVLGNEDPIASVPGEILPQTAFYSYESKYIDEKGAKLEIPSSLPKETMEKMQVEAVKAFKALQCEGLARVDFFLKQNGDIYVNEINTLPGFTQISMYPKLWEESGISYPELINRLIELAMERYKRDQLLKSSVY